MVSGRFFHKEGPMYDKVFCYVLVLRNGCLSFAKLLLVSILQCGANSKISFKLKRQFFIDKLENYCIYALVNSFFSREPIYLSKHRKRYMLHFI